MLGIHDFLLFIASGLLLNITPGADMLYVTSNSAAQGTRAGISAALGIFTGTLFHIAFAMVGLSAILATSAIAFTILKYVGATYLVYLGMKLLLEGRNTTPQSSSRSASSQFQVYKKGIFINLFNPKIALFFLAFLPQFIDSDSAHRRLAFLFLGLTFNFTGTFINSCVAWSTHSVSKRIANASRIGFWLKKTVGSLFVGLGLKLAVSGRS